MGSFKSLSTGVVVSVDDSKDERFASGYEPYSGESKSEQKKATTSRKSPSSNDEK